MPFIFIVLGIIVRTKILLLNLDPYQDAVALAGSIKNSYADLFKPLEFLQLAPPFFMVLSKFLVQTLRAENSLEYEDFVLRIIPYLSGIISLPLFTILVHKMFSNKIFTCVSSFIFIFNFYFIVYSLEFKQYSLEVLITLILLNIFLFVDLKAIKLKQLILFAIFLSLIPWLTPICMLVVISGLIVFIISMIKEKYFDLTKILIIILPMLASCLIFYYVYYINIYSSHYESFKDFWINFFFTKQNFIDLFPSKLLDIENLYSPIKKFYFYTFLILNIVLLIKGRNLKNIILCICPILLYIVMSFMKMYPYEIRFILFLLPLFIILFCQVLLLLKESLILNIFIYTICIYSFCTSLKQNEFKIYYVQDSHIRTVFEILKKYNPQLKNVIGFDTLYKSYAGKYTLFNEAYAQDFKNSEIPNFIENSNENEFWIYVPEYYESYNKQFQHYLETNDKISLEFMYKLPENENLFVAKIKKK